MNTEPYELGIQYEYGLDIHRIGTLLPRTFVFARYKNTEEYKKIIGIRTNTKISVLKYEFCIQADYHTRKKTIPCIYTENFV